MYCFFPQKATKGFEVTMNTFTVTIIVTIMAMTSLTYSFPQRSLHKYDEHCHGLECPKYKVLNSTSDYEIRRYSGYKWATTSSNESSKN